MSNDRVRGDAVDRVSNLVTRVKERTDLLLEAKRVIYYIAARQVIDDDTVQEFFGRLEKELRNEV